MSCERTEYRKLNHMFHVSTVESRLWFIAYGMRCAPFEVKFVTGSMFYRCSRFIYGRFVRESLFSRSIVFNTPFSFDALHNPRNVQDSAWKKQLKYHRMNKYTREKKNEKQLKNKQLHSTAHHRQRYISIKATAIVECSMLRIYQQC